MSILPLQCRRYVCLTFQSCQVKSAVNDSKDKRVSSRYHNQYSSGHASLDDDTTDEGELKSEESDIEISDSSEEGEVLSDLDEVDAKVEHLAAKDETPWERGLRLARERLEKAKALKAAEKDLAEKRMTLSIPVQMVDDELEQASKGDVLWPSYYQVCIIGRTELTSLRFLPEDLRPPAATELAKWRLGLSDEYTGRKRRTYRRDSRRDSSETMSSSASSSSRASSRSSSRDSSSVASSLASVAGSWKATCAKAMKDYLSSPIRNKDRRGGRYHRGPQRSPSASSVSNSQSSDSRSGSDRSTDHRGSQRHGYGSTVDDSMMASSGQRLWTDGKRGSRRSRSESEQSSASRSGSQSSTSRPAVRKGRQDWKRGARRNMTHEDEDEQWQGSGDQSGSDSSVRRRSDVPPLPHERPVKRPWVAAPSLATSILTAPPNQAAVLRTRSREDSNSSAHSGGSNASPTADDKRFITSWSKSPSSDEGQRPSRGAVRRQRLPDVVPGSHAGHVRGTATPRRKKSRSPYLIDQRQRGTGPEVPEPPHPANEFSIPHRSAQPPPQEGRDAPPLVSPALQLRQEPPSEPTLVTSAQPTTTAGELPSASNRPGVRMTLAPRIKASTVDMTNLAGGVTRTTTGRTFQPSPPRVPRLPFPVPSMNRGVSPSAPGHPLPNFPNTIDQNEIRRQAEAAAAIVEERERRRAAAEAAKRRRNPNHKKRDDLSKIPIRGRPTYRRLSFSDSSLDSGSSSRSRSSSRSGQDSHSRHQSPVDVSDTARLPQDARNIQITIDQRPHKSHKRTRPMITPDYGRVGPVDDGFSKGNRPIVRGPPPDEYSREFFEGVDARQHRMKAGHETSHRHRSDRIPKTNIPTHRSSHTQMQNMYGEYSVDQQSGVPGAGFRHREPKSFDLPNQAKHGMVYDDAMQRYEAGGRRGGMVYTQQQQQQAQVLERPRRPRTPHADLTDGIYNTRSPHMNVNLHRTIKNDRKRVEERSEDIFAPAPSRKRALIVEQEFEPGSNVDIRRARSRHRSRGPGAPIDRSEPFESDAGSFAAEQRLRELRERLNLVDDAIAELKAGSATGYVDARR
ncbi:unnamed protein product [Dicrocoelium dendriticum]|nr:unnamed protein product [Dicrocoelium dendriticum]